MSHPVIVIGMDGSALGTGARRAIDQARLVAGSARHLDDAGLPAGCERVPITPLPAALDRLRAAAALAAPAGSASAPAATQTAPSLATPSEAALAPATTAHGDGGSALVAQAARPAGAHPAPVVLASGDPGFFGIVHRLRAEGFTPQVVPAVSSIAAVFARLGRCWDGAAVVSAHGRGLRAALNACRALPLVAVLTEPGAGPAELGGGLAGWARRLAVAEQLGGPDERIVELAAADAAARTWAFPNVVVSLREPELPGASPEHGRARADNQPAATPAAGWALPESAYEHRASMITKSEIRALVVARLRPRLGLLVWDVGAGSGSVGIECAALGAAALAVEADAGACALVRRNADRHGVDVRVVHAAAPGVLAELPDPDAAFVGGGGVEVLAAVAARRPPRVVATLVALDRVAPAVACLRAEGYTVDGVQLTASRLADLADGSLRLAGTNPVVVLSGERS